MEQLTQSSDKNLSSPFVGMFLVPCELLGLYVFVTCSDHISTFPFCSQPFSLAIQCVHLQIDCILSLHFHCTAMQRKYQAVDMCSVLHQVSCCARITPYLHTPHRRGGEISCAADWGSNVTIFGIFKIYNQLTISNWHAGFYTKEENYNTADGPEQLSPEFPEKSARGDVPILSVLWMIYFSKYF